MKLLNQSTIGVITKKFIILQGQSRQQATCRVWSHWFLSSMWFGPEECSGRSSV